MFWSKARKIRKLEGELAAQAQVLDKEIKMKVAAQNSDKEYRKLAAERFQQLEDLTKARDLVVKELELIRASNAGALQEQANNAETYGIALLQKSQEIEQLKAGYEHEFKLRREFEEELGRCRAELARALGGTSNTPPGPLDQVDSFVRDSDTKDFRT